MSRRRIFVAAAAVAALALAALAGPSLAANECNGIPRCIPVEGPWVSVPASGEVLFALACPQRKGIVAGTDGQASSLDVRVSFDGILGAPVAFGRTTNTVAMFRAVSAGHKGGSFKPFIGCIPAPSAVRNTIAAKVTPAGPPLELRFASVAVRPGFQRTVTLACPRGESLVDSWSSTAFDSQAPPPPALASAIRVQAREVGGKVQLALSVSEALPPNVHAQVQIGVRCAS